MSSLFDVGKSAINSYRQSLAVTGQNIANINTEGYKRREATLEEVSGSQGSITSIQDQAGLGVRVTDITRSFDSFMQDRSRFAQSEYQSYETYLEQLQQLENQLLPGEGGIDKRLSSFFNSLYDVAIDPTSISTRVIALEQGKSVSDAFADTALQLTKLKSNTVNQMEDTLAAVNTLTAQMASVNEQITSNGQSGAAPNAVLDLRDRVLTDIAKLATISVDYSETGAAKVTLGTTGMGPTLVEGRTASKLEQRVVNDTTLQLVVNNNGSKSTTNQASGGVVHGLLMAFGSVDETLTSLNQLAVKVTRDVNAQHRMGMTLENAKGGDMFAVNGVSVTPNTANRGNASIEFTTTNLQLLSSSEMTLSYDKGAELWRLRDAVGTQLASGTSEINALGMSMIIHGQGQGADYFTVSPVKDAAAQMSFVVGTPEELAAASNSRISADTKNDGDAELNVIQLTGGHGDSTVGNSLAVDKALASSYSPILASEFLKTGLSTVVPTGTSAIDLSSFSRQGSAQFQVSDIELKNLSALNLTFTGTANNGPHSLNLNFGSVFPQAETGTYWTSMNDVADALNGGFVTTSGNLTISELGLYASGANGALTLSLATGDFDVSGSEPNLAVGLGQIQGSVQTAIDASDIQLFTREGRHVAGSALTTTEINELLIADNGFNVQAGYDGSYLNGVAGAYRGMGIKTLFSGGMHALSTGSNGVGAIATAASGSVPASPTISHVVAITLGNGSTASATIPLGASAAAAAKTLNATMDDIGVHTTARTRVELKTFTSAGEATFGLEGKNTQPVIISAQVTTSDLTNLALAINLHSATTGIAASLSSNKDRIILESDAGGDILIADITAATPDFTARVINDDGTAASSDILMGSVSGSGILDHARFSGVVKLTSSETISLVANSTTYLSSLDPETNGFVSVISDAASEKKQVRYDINGETDMSSASADGLRASAANAAYSFTVPTSNASISFTSTILASGLAEVSQSSVNKAVVNALRAQAPLASLSGGSVVNTNQISTFGFSGAEVIDSAADSFSVSVNGETITVDLTAGSGVTTHAELGAAFVAAINAASLDVVATTQVSGGQQQFVLTGKTAGQAFTVESFTFTDAANAGSPGSTLFVSSVAAIAKPADGSRVYVDFDGEQFEIEMVNGEIEISGGEADRLTAYFDVDGRLQVFAGGTLSGQTLSLSSDTKVPNNSAAAIVFGLSSNVSRLTGQEITVTASMAQLNIDFSGTAVAVDIATNGTVTTTPSPTGLTARYDFVSGSSGPGRLVLEFDPATYTLAVTPPEDAYGFKVGTSSLKVQSDHIEISSTVGDVVEFSAAATSRAQQKISLTDLPLEDLLVLITGTGPRLLGAQYDITPVESLVSLQNDAFTVQITDVDSGQVEIIDTATQHSIATRYLDQDGVTQFRDLQLRIAGKGQANDKFHFAEGVSQPGDARNINAIINLQNGATNDPTRTSFSEIFSTIVSKVGTSVQANTISVEAADARQQAAIEAEAGFSGVNLDSEASALIEFQQAYQASARILTTAREMFQTLIDTMR
jgi:flagellar hook-associated protein 1